MFGPEQFEQLYNMLDADMVDVDCGIRCGKFCCVGDGQSDNAFKYFLPGEAEYLVGHGFHNYAVLEDFGFLIHYHAIKADSCACQQLRQHRPFCCRAFPFRPVINEQEGRVIDLVKASEQRFPLCWIAAPLADWRTRAIAAWNFILSDLTNLQFYARYYLCLKKSETSTASYYQALQEDERFRDTVAALETMPRAELWRLNKSFFEYI